MVVVYLKLYMSLLSQLALITNPSNFKLRYKIPLSFLGKINSLLKASFSITSKKSLASGERNFNSAVYPLILFRILSHFFGVTHTVTHSLKTSLIT